MHNHWINVIGVFERSLRKRASPDVKIYTRESVLRCGNYKKVPDKKPIYVIARRIVSSTRRVHASQTTDLSTVRV